MRCSSSARARLHLAAAICGWIWASPAPCAPAEDIGGGHLAVGQDRFFNQEYDLAVASFRHLADGAPQDPVGHLLLAKALIYQELERLGLISTSAFRGDAEFNDRDKPKPDEAAGRRIDAALRVGERLCERALDRDADDVAALYSLARIHALRANYEFMAKKAYFKALASGKRGRALSYRAGRLRPEFADALLVAGINEYIVGSLPWAVRAVIALSGYRGSRKKGVAIIARVAAEGTVNRDDARALLALLHRKEGRHLQAARELESLASDFPRAYTYCLEAATMHVAAGDKRTALDRFREVRRKQRSGQDRYDRMPRRMADALDRRIASLEEELAAEARRQ